MTSESEVGRTTEMPYTDPRDAGPWYKCPVCHTCLNNGDQFLIHVSSHNPDDHGLDGQNMRGHLSKKAKIEIESEDNKPIFHTQDGSVFRINELPNAYAIFIPKIQLRPLELICRDSEIRVQQPNIKLLRPTEADLQAAREEANKRQLRRKPRREYGGPSPSDDDDIIQQCEEDTEDGNYDPKCGQRGWDKSSRNRRNKPCILKSSSGGRLRKKTSELSSPNPPSSASDPAKICVLCFPSIPFKTMPEFTAHITEVHWKDGTYFCTSCSFKTVNRKSIVKHNCRKDVSRIWKGLQPCDKCGKSISKYLIKDHLEMHKRKDERNKLKPFRCVICKEGFTQKCNLQRHMFMHLENNPFVCEFPGCNHNFTGKYHLKRHMDLHYGTRLNFPCTICNKDFCRKARLIEHNRLYHSEDGPKRIYRPRKTIQIIKRWADLTTAASETTQSVPVNPDNHEPDSVLCPDAEQQQQTNNGRIYLDSIHLGDEETIKAEALEALLDVDQELVARGIHEQQGVKSEPDSADEIEPKSLRPSEPTGISDSSKDESNISSRSEKTAGTGPNTICTSKIDVEEAFVHKQLKVNPDIVKLLGTKYTNRGDEGAFPCKICIFPKIAYSRLHHLLSHMKKVHPEEGAKHLGEISAESGIVLTCDTCGFQTNNSQQLAQHMKKHGNRKFRCPNCRVRFQTQARLDKHMRDIHGGEKRFKCNECDKAFSSSGGLRWHRRKVHVLPSKEPQELTCQHCGRTASSKTQLKNHMLLHSKNRVLSYCKICNEKLSCPSSLRRHIRLIHMNNKSGVEKVNESMPEAELFL